MTEFLDYTRGIGEYIEISEYFPHIPESIMTKIRIKKYICRNVEVI